MVSQIDNIDEKQFENSEQDIDFLAKVESQIKAIDMIAYQCEEIIQNSPENLESIKESIENIWNMIAVLGGVSGLSLLAENSDLSSEELSYKLFSTPAITTPLINIHTKLSDYNLTNTQISEVIIEVGQVDSTNMLQALDSVGDIIENKIGEEFSDISVILEMQKLQAGLKDLI